MDSAFRRFVFRKTARRRNDERGLNANSDWPRVPMLVNRSQQIVMKRRTTQSPMPRNCGSEAPREMGSPEWLAKKQRTFGRDRPDFQRRLGGLTARRHPLSRR